MSFNSFLQPTQTLCQQDITFAAGDNGLIASCPIGGVIAAGGKSPAGTYQDFHPSTSKIIGAVGKTLTNVPVFQNVSATLLEGTLASNLAKSGLIAFASSLAADQSTYTVYWVNTVYAGISPC